MNLAQPVRFTTISHSYDLETDQLEAIVRADEHSYQIIIGFSDRTMTIRDYTFTRERDLPMQAPILSAFVAAFFDAYLALPHDSSPSDAFPLSFDV